MKLQYLGDYRDAFKWDLLHWVCTRAVPPFDRLLFVPLLTPDDQVARDGQIHHRQFAAREFIHEFVEQLREAPRSLSRVKKLGIQPRQTRFDVVVHGPELHVPLNAGRGEYWHGLSPADHARTVVFCDPDNGFETKTQNGPKWVRHLEIAELLTSLPASSGVIVYQHRPRRPWASLFAELRREFDGYAPFACAAYDPTLSLIALARSATTFMALKQALMSYSAQHPRVQFTEMLRADV